MLKIKKILEKQSISLSDLLSCFEEVKNNGDVVVIKFDGERDENQYTVFISFPQNKNRPMIRVDNCNLKEAFFKVLSEYVK